LGAAIYNYKNEDDVFKYFMYFFSDFIFGHVN